jgi:hypothetical protein
MRKYLKSSPSKALHLYSRSRSSRPGCKTRPSIDGTERKGLRKKSVPRRDLAYVRLTSEVDSWVQIRMNVGIIIVIGTV